MQSSVERTRLKRTSKRVNEKYYDQTDETGKQRTSEIEIRKRDRYTKTIPAHHHRHHHNGEQVYEDKK